MKSERLEELIERGHVWASRNCIGQSKHSMAAIEQIIREAWLMGKSEYVDRPPFVTENDLRAAYELGKHDGRGEITDEGDLP